MPGIMSQPEADQLLAMGQISPEAHAAISSQNAAGPLASVAPPMAPPPPVDAGAPPPLDGGMSMAAPMTPAAPPPMADAGPPLPAGAPAVPLAGGVSGGGPQASIAEPNMSMAPPPGDVVVGKVQQTNKPAPAPAPVPIGINASPRSVSFYDQRTGAEIQAPSPNIPPPKPVDFRVAAQGQRDVELDRRAQAQAEAGAAREQRAQELAAQASANAAALDARAKEDAAALAKDEANTQAALADLNGRVADYATKTVDADRWWKNQSTGNRIVASLATALGGFAEGLSNGAVKNTALAQINRYIDADIRAQEVDLATKGKALDAKRGVVHDMMQMTQNREAARSAARVVGLQNAELQAKAIAAKFDPKLEKPATQEILSAIQTEKVNENEKMGNIFLAERRAAAAAAAAAAAKREQTIYDRGKETDAAARDWARIQVDAKKTEADIAKSGANPAAKEAAKEDSAYAADMKALNDAWKTAVETNYSSRATKALGKFFDTDNFSANTGATSQLVGTVKGPGDNSETDAIRLQSMLPRAGDDKATLDRKYALLVNKANTKHPQAAERFAAKKTVKTSAPPGE